MFSFLNEIDKYIKENKIPLKSIEFSYTYLPSFINQAILYKLRKVSDNFEFGCATYELRYDKNGNLCLVAKNNDKSESVSIINKDCNANIARKTVTYNEEKLIREACMLRYFDNIRQKIRRIIEKDYSNYPKIEKIKCEYYTMNDFINQKRHTDPKLYHDITNKVEYTTPLMDSVELITSYIDHIYDASIVKPQPIIKKEENKGISYREPEKDEPLERNAPNFTFGPSKERINDIIATDVRFSVLESFPYIYRDYAYNVFNKEINYMAYMYHIDTESYIIIMEPYNGTKYTKIVGIYDPEEMTKEKFDSYVKHYLELSKHKSLNDDKIVRISHTSFTQYERKMKYAIAYLQDELCSNYFKTKIRKLREHK